MREHRAPPNLIIAAPGSILSCADERRGALREGFGHCHHAHQIRSGTPMQTEGFQKRKTVMLFILLTSTLAFAGIHDACHTEKRELRILAVCLYGSCH
jgi:hypothetical protein